MSISRYFYNFEIIVTSLSRSRDHHGTEGQRAAAHHGGEAQYAARRARRPRAAVVRGAGLARAHIQVC